MGCVVGVGVHRHLLKIMRGFVILFACLSVSFCLSVFLSGSLFVCLYLCLPVSLFLFVCLSFCLYVCHSVCLSVCLCLFVFLHVCLSVFLSVCLYGMLWGALGWLVGCCPGLLWAALGCPGLLLAAPGLPWAGWLDTTLFIEIIMISLFLNYLISK